MFVLQLICHILMRLSVADILTSVNFDVNHYQPDLSLFCTENHINPKIRSFENIWEYQNNNVSSFNPADDNFDGNFVTFKNFTTKLKKEIFHTNSSMFIIQLDLHGKAVTEIQTGAFDYLDCLKYLILKNNALEEVTNETFISLPRLLELDLSYNVLQIIRSWTFQELKYLKTLDLSDNIIKTIEKFAFIDLTRLQFLDLSNNRLKEVSLMDYPVYTEILDLRGNLDVDCPKNPEEEMSRKILCDLKPTESPDDPITTNPTQNISTTERPSKEDIEKELEYLKSRLDAIVTCFIALYLIFLVIFIGYIFYINIKRRSDYSYPQMQESETIPLLIRNTGENYI